MDKSTAGYAADKEGWFTDYAAPRMDAWAQRTGWQPPSYTSPEPGTAARDRTGGGTGRRSGTAQS